MVLKKKAKMKLLEKLSTEKGSTKTVDDSNFTLESYVNQIAGWTPKLSVNKRNKEAKFLEIPKDTKLKKGELWCPYCGKVFKFKSDGLGNKRCINCGIGNNCFYVRVVNRLWK